MQDRINTDSQRMVEKKDKKNLTPQHLFHFFERAMEAPVHRFNRNSTGNRGVVKYRIAQKERIVKEAYAVPRNIKNTAQLYGIEPKQIRYWRKAIAKAKNESTPEQKGKPWCRIETPKY